ncbi:MAG: uroporphyrinogen-III synthase [Rhodobacteraceae bacterium]|nr:uroporphyrinogen-III synthase [Alphaproteobacteria bacterium]NNK68085.1 uroporphyrinogen-III synthase [Paracoccaceae bacterium]
MPSLIAPVITIEPVGNSVDTSRYAGVIFTSSNAVPDRAERAGMAAYCVGDRTADVARAAGYSAVSASGDADALVKEIGAKRAEGSLLHMRGETARGDIAERLIQAGVPTDEVITYRQVAIALAPDVMETLMNAPAILAPVFSPMSAAALAKSLEPAGLAPTIVAISRSAADAYTGPISAREVAATPDANAMADLIAAHYRRDSAC